MKKKAFTLMEIVIILFIASVGIMASLSLAIRSSYFQSVKKDLIAVSFLSAEGLELMTNIRDTNIILADDYDNWDSLGAPINTTTYYYKVDFNSLIATSVSSISNAILQKNDQGIFLHDSSYANSVFKRIISTKSDDNFSSTTIESWIQWENRGNTYDYKIETILYDLSF